MSKQQIAVTPQQDLHAIVANAPKNAELILAPGKYILNRPLVVDKTIVMRSQTGKADDVMIGRNNATVLIVTDGKPTFQGILFFAPAKTDDAPVNTNEHDFIEYSSAVAVRQKGNATFIECKASSRQKSGFSARGKKAFITLDKCLVYQTGDGGIFVDDKACGLVKNSLIQNTGLGCVDAESKGSVLTVENSTLAKSEFASISPHNEGLVVVRNCKINAGSSYAAFVQANGRIEIKDSTIFSDADDEKADPEHLERFGLVIDTGSAQCANCLFSKLNIGVYMLTSEAKLKLKNVDMEKGMMASIVYSGESPKIKISNCTFGAPPLEKGWLERLDEQHADDSSPENSNRHYVTTAKWNKKNYTRDELDRAYDLKTEYCKKVLGKEFQLCLGSDTPFYEKGGRLSLFYYLQSRFGGTFLLTKDLVCPDFSDPSFDDVDSYELAIASRAPFYYDAQGNPSPDYDKLVKPYERLYGCLTMAALYIWDESGVSRYNTIELPDGRKNLYFIFDLIDEPGLIDVGAQDAVTVYQLKTDAVLYRQSVPHPENTLDSQADENEENKETVQRKFGVMVMIQLHKSELDYIRAHEGSSKIFIAKLKEQGNWPFSDLNRPAIF